MNLADENALLGIAARIEYERKNLPRVSLVVTRHPGLVAYLKTQRLVSYRVRVITHASAQDVRDQHVLGVLPHSLSCLTRAFTEVPLDLPPELRGKELSEADVAEYAAKPVTYIVTKK